MSHEAFHDLLLQKAFKSPIWQPILNEFQPLHSIYDSQVSDLKNKIKFKREYILLGSFYHPLGVF